MASCTVLHRQVGASGSWSVAFAHPPLARLPSLTSETGPKIKGTWDPLMAWDGDSISLKVAKCVTL